MSFNLNSISEKSCCFDSIDWLLEASLQVDDSDPYDAITWGPKVTAVQRRSLSKLPAKIQQKPASSTGLAKSIAPIAASPSLKTASGLFPSAITQIARERTSTGSPSAREQVPVNSTSESISSSSIPNAPENPAADLQPASLIQSSIASSTEATSVPSSSTVAQESATSPQAQMSVPNVVEEADSATDLPFSDSVELSVFSTEEAEEEDASPRLNISKFMRARIQKLNDDSLPGLSRLEHFGDSSLSEVLENQSGLSDFPFKRLRCNRKKVSEKELTQVTHQPSSHNFKKLCSKVARAKKTSNLYDLIEVGSERFTQILDEGKNHALRTFKKYRSRLDISLTTFREYRDERKKEVPGAKKTSKPSDLIEVGSEFFTQILEEAQDNAQRTFEKYRTRLNISLTTFIEYRDKQKKEIHESQHAAIAQQNSEHGNDSGPIHKDSPFFRRILAEAAVYRKGIPTYRKYASRLNLSQVQFLRHVHDFKKGAGAYSKRSPQVEAIDKIDLDSELFNEILDKATGYRKTNSTYEEYKDRLPVGLKKFVKLVNKRKESFATEEPSENAQLETSDSHEQGSQSKDETLIQEGTDLFNQLLQKASGYRMINSVYREHEHRLKMSRATFQNRVNSWKEENSISVAPPLETAEPSKLAEIVEEAIRENNVDKIHKLRNTELKGLGVTFDIFRKEVWIAKVNKDLSGDHRLPGFYFTKKDTARILNPELKKQAEEYRKKRHERVKAARAKNKNK